jgi:hypothetical protein
MIYSAQRRACGALSVCWLRPASDDASSGPSVDTRKAPDESPHGTRPHPLLRPGLPRTRPVALARRFEPSPQTERGSVARHARAG